MNDVRIIVCPDCGGDKGFDVPHDIDRQTGALMTHWVGCRLCDEKGEIEIEVFPITIEDLEAA